MTTTYQAAKRTIWAGLRLDSGSWVWESIGTRRGIGAARVLARRTAREYGMSVESGRVAAITDGDEPDNLSDICTAGGQFVPLADFSEAR